MSRKCVVAICASAIGLLVIVAAYHYMRDANHLLEKNATLISSYHSIADIEREFPGLAKSIDFNDVEKIEIKSYVTEDGRNLQVSLLLMGSQASAIRMTRFLAERSIGAVGCEVTNIDIIADQSYFVVCGIMGSVNTTTIVARSKHKIAWIVADYEMTYNVAISLIERVLGT